MRGAAPLRAPVAIVLAVAVLASYNVWALAFLTPQVAPLSGYLSELAAAAQPGSWVYRLGDALAGALMIVIGLLGVSRWRGHFGGAGPWIAWSVVLMGAATIGDAIAVMPCAPTHDPQCRVLYPQAPSGPGFTLHTAFSATVGAAFLAGLALAAWGRRSLRLLGTAVLALGLMLVTWLLETRVGSGQGYAQAIQVVLLALWVGWLAVLSGRWGSDAGDDRALSGSEGAS